MTNEQAIKWLKDYIQNTPFQMEQYERALEMAIQSLSQVSEIEENIIKYMKKYPNHVGNTDFWEGFYACRNVVLQLDDEEYAPKEQEPCDDIAQERYKDLCEYFGGAKDILKSREDFKAWLERVKWHIHKAEELYEKYEYKKEPCDDAVSREAVLDEIEKWIVIELQYTNAIPRLIKRINELPPVTQKSGKWIPVSERLPEDKTYVLTTIKVPNRVAHARSGWYEGGFFHNDNGDTWRATDREVTAWMPLPKPYEPQESEARNESKG